MPKFQPSPEFTESISWVDFKKEIQIWQILSTLDVKKQEPCLYFLFKRKTREIALKIDIEEIMGDNTVKLILEKQEKLHLENATQTY